jgi:hypothetical protein
LIEPVPVVMSVPANIGGQFSPQFTITSLNEQVKPSCLPIVMTAEEPFTPEEASLILHMIYFGDALVSYFYAPSIQLLQVLTMADAPS